ncbi:hypothetical protein [Telmatospirillum siberiense]|uniref:Type II secretion system protein GspI n=1 Tax=Telmatospirillum siberiense TaxID=382514 RepID=A0A2N3PMD6_9PROT|nr:hypothetical protein [Telmatospirillum siberiense]PKU21569.1 hypothetical protein CWS72_26010 [Telmatospirillum siberiense]
MSRKRQAGFALVEAIVAAAIIAGALVAMFAVMIDGATRSRLAEDKRLGLLVAESRLAAVGAEIPVRVGSFAGVEGPFTWEVAINPYRMAVGRSDAGDVYQVSVAVRLRSRSTSLVELRSLRLASTY